MFFWWVWFQEVLVLDLILCADAEAVGEEVGEACVYYCEVCFVDVVGTAVDGESVYIGVEDAEGGVGVAIAGLADAAWVEDVAI